MNCKICYKYIGGKYYEQCCRSRSCKYIFKKIYKTTNYRAKVSSFRGSAIKDTAADLINNDELFKHFLTKVVMPKIEKLNENRTDNRFLVKLKTWQKIIDIAYIKNRPKVKPSTPEIVAEIKKKEAQLDKTMPHLLVGDSREFLLDQKFKLPDDYKRKYRVELLTFTGLKVHFEDIFNKLGYKRKIQLNRLYVNERRK